MVTLLALASILAACAPSNDTGVATTDSRAVPGAWVWDDTTTGTQPLDPVVLAADLQANLEAVYQVTATAPLRSFQEAYAYHTDSCPLTPAITETDGYGTTLYFDGLCTNEQVDFKGPALFYTWDDDEIQPIAAMEVAGGLPPGSRWTGYGFNGQTDIYSDDGLLDFNCSCTMVEVTGVAPDRTQWFFGITSGTAHWTGPEGQGTWMEDPAIVPELQLTIRDEGTHRSVRAGGTLSGVGERYTSMGWQLTLDGSRGIPVWDCSPEGSLAVTYRDDADSSWGLMDLQVEPDCTACGDAPGGEEICVNLVPLLDYSGSPW